MTMNQATALRLRCNMRADLSTDCAHRNLELEWNDPGHSTGHYTCIICGEPVLHKPQASSRDAHLTPAGSPRASTEPWLHLATCCAF